MTGQVIDGKFELLDEIGHGGMGVVYRARQISLDRVVALKMLSANLVEDAEFRERFRQEAKIIARLTHPNIVHVYDVFDVEGREGGFCIVMEYLEGRPLCDVLREERRLPIEKAVAIAEQVATGLAYAHNKGIIHRDIKPDNIMMLGDDRVKIMDFGIARLRGSSIQTQTGVAMGTPQFMSPEQAAGKSVDTRSDLYSLAVVLYGMVAGELPFTADSPVAMALKHIQEAPRRPSELNPAIPPALDSIILKGLAKRLAERYQSAEEFREALGRFAAGEGVAPTPERDETYVSTPVVRAAVVPPVEPKSRDAAAKPVAAAPSRRRRLSWVGVLATAPGLIALGLVLFVVFQRPEWLPGGRDTIAPEMLATWPFERQIYQLRYLQQKDPAQLRRVLAAIEPQLRKKAFAALRRQTDLGRLERAKQLREGIRDVISPYLTEEQRHDWTIGTEPAGSERTPGLPRREGMERGGSAGMYETLFARLDKKGKPDPEGAKKDFEKAQGLAREWDGVPDDPLRATTKLWNCVAAFVNCLVTDPDNWQYHFEFAQFLARAADQVGPGLRKLFRTRAYQEVLTAQARCSDPTKKPSVDELAKRLAPLVATPPGGPEPSAAAPTPATNK